MIYALEHSQYSEDNNLCCFHIGPLNQAIQANMRDCISNLRQSNKWQVVFTGTYDECHRQGLALFCQKRNRHPEWKENRQ